MPRITSSKSNDKTSNDKSSNDLRPKGRNENYQFESEKGKPTRLLNEAAERDSFFAAKKVRLVE